jgi:hypothetical protein
MSETAAERPSGAILSKQIFAKKAARGSALTRDEVPVAMRASIDL